MPSFCDNISAFSRQRFRLATQTLGIIGLVAFIVAFAAYQHAGDHERHVIQRAFMQSWQNQEPVVQDAIEQVEACELQADTTYHHDWSRGPQTWAWAQRVVWWPCMQQGDARLRERHADSQTPVLHERLKPVVEQLKRRYRGFRAPFGDSGRAMGDAHGA